MMEQKLKRLVINSNSIPKSIQTYIPSTLCLHNINLFKEYIKCNQMRESFQFTRRYTRFSEFLLPQTTTRVVPYENTHKKSSKLFLKDVNLHPTERNCVKNKLWKQVINSPSNEFCSSMKRVSPEQLNFSFSSKTTNRTNYRVQSSKPNRYKKLPLQSRLAKKGNDCIKFQCLFRNDLIKRMFTNDPANKNDKEKENGQGQEQENNKNGENDKLGGSYCIDKGLVIKGNAKKRIRVKVLSN